VFMWIPPKINNDVECLMPSNTSYIRDIYDRA
jgi:hypothetical protein